MIAIGSDHGGFALKEEIKSIWTKKRFPMRILALTVPTAWTIP